MHNLAWRLEVFQQNLGVQSACLALWPESSSSVLVLVLGLVLVSLKASAPQEEFVPLALEQAQVSPQLTQTATETACWQVLVFPMQTVKAAMFPVGLKHRTNSQATSVVVVVPFLAFVQGYSLALPKLELETVPRSLGVLGQRLRVGRDLASLLLR